MLSRTVRVLVATLALSAWAVAAGITGAVINKTTNKPAAGDEVTVMKLAQGMVETGRVKTDAQGRFTVQVEEGAPYLIRVTHQNVAYHRSAPPGTTSVEVEVFDAAKQVAGVTQTLNVMRMEADAVGMRVIELVAFKNASSPPQTLMNPKNTEIVLPGGAEVEQAMASGPGGLPVTSRPTPTGEKNHYTFDFPLRPGETRFQIAYTLPYNGSTSIRPKLLRPTDDFAVSLPKSMQLIPLPGSRLEARGEDSGLAVYVASATKPGQELGFTVSGTGTVPEEANGPADQSGAAQAGGNQAAGGANRPGGGIGAPVNAPDAMDKYKWWILAAVVLVMIGGAAYTMGSPARTPATGGASLLDAFKEELFQLESDRVQGKISDDEYAKAKAALDIVLARAMAKRDS